MTIDKNIRVAVCGACGRMGREVVKAVLAQKDLELVAAIDISNIGSDIGDIIENKTYGVKITESLQETLQTVKADVVVDFTIPEHVYKNALTALESGVRPVIGTTGLTTEQLNDIENLSIRKNLGALIAPNFAIGAVLMMMFSEKASEYFENAEIIELHHNKKVDAPSGTALKTAEMMTKSRSAFGKDNVPETETLQGSRGGMTEANIRIHSVRLPGFVAHQEVIFGAAGQALTIRHDSFDRTSFMPGVVLAVKKVVELNKFIYGLENIL